jgi:hypothetical protein
MCRRAPAPAAAWPVYWYSSSAGAYVPTTTSRTAEGALGHGSESTVDTSLPTATSAVAASLHARGKPPNST